MGDEWREAPLGEFIELKRGYDLPRQHRAEGRVPIVSSSGPSGWHNEPMVTAPGVVTGRYGTLGQVFYVTEDFWPLNTTLYVRDFKGNDPKFISYFLRTLDFLSCSDKAAVPGVNRNHLHQISVAMPPLPDQRAIAHILGSLDDKIQLNRKMNETLEAMARALFKSWFVDFDPVHAKSDGKKPHGIGDATSALFPHRFVDSELDPIPEGWAVQPIGSTVEIWTGGTPKRSEADYWGEGVPWFSVRDAPSEADVFVISTSESITELGLASSSAKLLPTGATIITARGTVGRLAMTAVPMAMNQSCYALTGSTPSSANYTHYLLRTAVSGLQQHAHGAVFDTITRATFDSVRAVIPPSELRRAFDEISQPWLSQIKAHLWESATLAELRDTLLPELLSGTRRIPDVERLISKTV